MESKTGLLTSLSLISCWRTSCKESKLHLCAVSEFVLLTRTVIVCWLGRSRIPRPAGVARFYQKPTPITLILNHWFLVALGLYAWRRSSPSRLTWISLVLKCFPVGTCVCTTEPLSPSGTHTSCRTWPYIGIINVLLGYTRRFDQFNLALMKHFYGLL